VLSASTEVRRPVRDVFRYVCDWRNYQDLWGESIQILNPESLDDARLGQVTALTQTSGKAVMHAVSTLTRFEEDRLVEWDTAFPKVVNAGREENPPLPNVLVTCEFSEDDALTRLKVSLKVHGKFPVAMKLIVVVGILVKRRSLAKSLRAIKMQLEA
jgi:hypothetical protein